MIKPPGKKHASAALWQTIVAFCVIIIPIITVKALLSDNGETEAITNVESDDLGAPLDTPKPKGPVVTQIDDVEDVPVREREHILVNMISVITEEFEKESGEPVAPTPEKPLSEKDFYRAVPNLDALCEMLQETISDEGSEGILLEGETLEARLVELRELLATTSQVKDAKKFITEVVAAKSRSLRDDMKSAFASQEQDALKYAAKYAERADREILALRAAQSAIRKSLGVPDSAVVPDLSRAKIDVYSVASDFAKLCNVSRSTYLWTYAVTDGSPEAEALRQKFGEAQAASVQLIEAVRKHPAIAGNAATGEIGNATARELLFAYSGSMGRRIEKVAPIYVVAIAAL